MWRTSLVCALWVLVAVGGGCSSIHSTHVKRNEEACGWDTKDLHGIPITLDVPDKFKIEILETQYFDKLSGKVVRNAIDGKPVVTRNVNVTVINKKEIFTVDFIKPAAGQLTTAVDFDPKTQYFTEINNKITDTTIDAITAAINTVGSSLAPLVGGRTTGVTPTSSADLQTIDRMVAVGVFDVSDRQALEKIHAFLCQHLNGCTPPCVPGEPLLVEPGPPVLPPSRPILLPPSEGLTPSTVNKAAANGGR
jgi:hypothetical protein